MGIAVIDRKLRVLTLWVLTVSVLLLSIACGGEDAGLSRAEVEEIARAEMAESPAAPPAEPGVTSADMDRAIRAALADMPQPESGLSRSEVEAIVKAALADIPQPKPGLSSAEIERIARGVVASIPPRSAPAAYTKFFVNNAISRYETQGLDATLAYYNRVESVEGQWYVFIVDDNDKVIGHPDGSLIGLDLKGWVGTDVNGYNFGPEILSAAEDGRWVSYVYRNPETGPIGAAFGELQLKNAWVVRHDGLLFGSGWYVDAEEFTKSFVAAAVSKFNEVGLEGTVEYFTGSESDFAGLAAAIDYYNSIETVEGKWAAFIADGSGTIVDHYDKALVGTDLRDLLGFEIPPAPAEGNWVTREDVRVWVVGYDGMTFGSGWRHDESGS